MGNPRRTALRIAALVLLFTTGATTLNAQPVLTFTRIVTNWPTIEVYFRLACDGQPEFSASKQNFTVMENGSPIDQFTMWCPDPRQRCAISTALVVDASGSMAANLMGALDGVSAYIDLMDGIADEAALLRVGSDVTVLENMTTNKVQLQSTLYGISAGGLGALWDGVYTGLQELIVAGGNPCRAVIVVSDGTDNASQHTPTEIIALAQRNRIRVFTIGVGNPQPVNLETIATLTGGKYFQTPSPSLLASIYQEISTIVFGGFYECIITYDATCPDGMLRRVDLNLNDFCGGDDSKTKTYRAPLDTTQVESFTLSMEDVTLSYGETKTIPVRFHASKPVTIGPAEFTIGYGLGVVESATINKTGTVLENIPTTISEANGQFTISMNQSVQLAGDGFLIAMDVTAKTTSVVYNDDLKFVDWTNIEERCLNVTMNDGSITLPVNSIGSYAATLARTFTVAPNPSDGKFELAVEFTAPTAFRTRIVNALGQTVYEQEIAEKRVSYREHIQLPNAPAGVYFLLLESGNRYDFRKVVLR